MISEGPTLIEPLPTDLQGALNGALRPTEELRIAVRGNSSEALAVTTERVILLKEPLTARTDGVQLTEITLSALSSPKSESDPRGGRLTWQSSQPGVPTLFEFPSYDGAKFTVVARRMAALLGEKRKSSGGVVSVGAVQRSCPKCQAAIPAEGCWCPQCGFQAFDPCWECGKPLSAGARYCAYCGTPNTQPAVVACPECSEPVGREFGYCPWCGTQARRVCEDCDRPLRREWSSCPDCGGDPSELDDDEEPYQVNLPIPATPAPAVTQSAEALNAEGVRAYEAENYTEAVRHFRAAAEAAPDNASYHTNLGVALGEAGQDNEALSAYRRAIELNARELPAYLNLGYLFSHKERYSEAREMWEKVVALAPDSEEAAEARQNLANLEEV